jgi:hypothetical protein
MRRTLCAPFAAIALLCSLGVLTAAPGRAAAPGPPADASAARPLQIVHASGILDGTCVLVSVEPREHDVMLHFITSARLFKTAEGQPLPPARAIRVTLDDGSEVAVQREDVFLPVGNLVDVAVLRAAAPNATFVSEAMTFSVPPPERDFLIAGYDRDGAPATVAEHVRFVSPRLVVGDRDASGLAGCVGAPAISADGFYGVVSECDVDRVPIVTPLSIAYSFIARHVPELLVRPTLSERP